MAQKSVEDLFRDFSRSDDFPDVLKRFECLRKTARVPDSSGIESVYSRLKSSILTEEAKNLWKLLDSRAAHEEYWNESVPPRRACQGMKILIVGAGPCGLRMSIECALLGAQVFVIEKRNYFSRNNILHLWPFAMHDLKSIGAKVFYPKFGSGCLDNIGTRKLQLLLLKIALLLGVEVYTPAEFIDVVEKISESGETEWKGLFGPGSAAKLSDLSFNVVIGADGRHQTVKGFPQKLTRGKMAIAVIVNFVNTRTKAEIDVKEVPGLVFFCDQNFFNKIKADTGIDLENFVYYKEDTHYFVMCAKKSCLLSKGVIKQDKNDVKSLLDTDNIDRKSLLDFTRQATKGVIGHIPDLNFARNHRGEEDVAIFDFTSIYQAENSCYAVVRNERNLLVCCIGDALIQPFWPTGTGVAKGFLSVFDAAWLLRSWAISKDRSHLELIGEREALRQLLSQVTPQNLSDHFRKYTINPITRYKTKIDALPIAQVQHLYKTSGMIETQVSSGKRKGDEIDQPGPSKKSTPGGKTLLAWFQERTKPFSDVAPVTDLFNSWRNGLAFCALIQFYRPSLIDVRKLNAAEVVKNVSMAFNLIEEEFGVAPILSPEDFGDSGTLDVLSVMSYLFMIYQTLLTETIRDENTVTNALEDSLGLNNWTKCRSASRKLRDIVVDDDEFGDYSQFCSLSSTFGMARPKTRAFRTDNKSATLRSLNRNSGTFKQFRSLHHPRRASRKSKKSSASNSPVRRSQKLNSGRHNAIRRKSEIPDNVTSNNNNGAASEASEINVEPAKQVPKPVVIARTPSAPQAQSEHGHPSLMMCRGVRDRISKFNAATDQESNHGKNSGRANVKPQGSLKEEIGEDDNQVLPASNSNKSDLENTAADETGDEFKSLNVSDMASKLEDMTVKSSTLSVCCVCKKTLYIVDRRVAHGCVFHFDCFKCSTCNIRLRLDKSCVKKDSNGDAKFYCFKHYYQADGLTAVWTKDGEHEDNKETEFSLRGPYSLSNSDESDGNKDMDDEFQDAQDSDVDEEFWSFIQKPDDNDNKSDDASDDADDGKSKSRRFFNTAVSMSLILNNALQENKEKEEILNDEGRTVEENLRARNRESRVLAAEDSDELIQEWLSVMQRKIELCDRQSQIMLSARLMELQELEQQRLTQLKNYKKHGGGDDPASWIEEDVTRLTSEIADLQDFLDIHQQLGAEGNL